MNDNLDIYCEEDQTSLVGKERQVPEDLCHIRIRNEYKWAFLLPDGSHKRPRSEIGMGKR